MTAALQGAAVGPDATALHADELRLGLRGQGRRVLAPRGVKVRQRLQVRYEWAYLLLGVAPRSGELRWRWIERMRQEQIEPVLADWGAAAVIWDGAGAHRGKQLAELPTARVVLPPYSPEPNPAGRVFEEVRRRVEGRVYDSLAAKRAEVDAFLQGLAADPARVRRLCDWGWIRDAFAQLPSPP